MATQPTDSPTAAKPNNYLPAPRLSRIYDKNEKMEAEFEQEKATGFSERIRRMMFGIGVNPRDQKTNRPTIPEAITRLKCWNAFPAYGFGMIGPTGCGKSCALVEQMRKVLIEELAAGGPPCYDDLEQRREIAPVTEFKWIDWPAYASRMKNLAARREWQVQEASTEILARWLETDQDHKRVLILDDLGMERFGKDGGGYALEQLELLLNVAYGYEARLFWTSNKHVQDTELNGVKVLGLANPAIYGPRLVSRLTGLSPDTTLPFDLPDLRIRKME